MLEPSLRSFAEKVGRPTFSSDQHEFVVGEPSVEYKEILFPSCGSNHIASSL